MASIEAKTYWYGDFSSKILKQPERFERIAELQQRSERKRLRIIRERSQ